MYDNFEQQVCLKKSKMTIIEVCQKHRILILFGCSQIYIAHPRLPFYAIVSEWSYDATAAVLEEDQRAEVEDKSHT